MCNVCKSTACIPFIYQNVLNISLNVTQVSLLYCQIVASVLVCFFFSFVICVLPLHWLCFEHYIARELVGIVWYGVVWPLIVFVCKTLRFLFESISFWLSNIIHHHCTGTSNGWHDQCVWQEIECGALQCCIEHSTRSAQAIVKRHKAKAKTNTESTHKRITPKKCTDGRVPRTSLFIVKMALNFHIWHNNFACYVHAALHLSHRMRNIVVNRIYLFIYIQKRAHVWSSRFVFFFFLLKIFI